MDEWLLKGDSEQLQNQTSDRCYDKEGKVIAQGIKVWDGDWNNKSHGECTSTYPIYTNSRIQAGGPWQGSIFKCKTMSVEQAIKLGLYGDQDMTLYVNQLKEIYPDGVCDYRFDDIAKPQDMALAKTIE